MVWLEILNPVNNLDSELMLALFLKLSDMCCVQHGVSHWTSKIIIDFCYVSDFVFFFKHLITPDYSRTAPLESAN